MSEKRDPDSRRRLEQLFAEHGQAVLAFALRRTADPDDAADVLADTMLVAWRKLDRIPSGPDARPWLFGVARRVLANAARSRRRRHRLGERLRRELHAAGPFASAPDTRREGVREALGRLPEADREILLLTAWEGLDPSQAARVLELTPATARTRLHRARKRLRRELSAEGPRDPQPAPSLRQRHERSSP